MDIRTTSSEGLVFYAGTKKSFMALYLLKGHLVFALGEEGKKLRLKSKETYNDGKWHTVRSWLHVKCSKKSEIQNTAKSQNFEHDMAPQWKIPLLSLSCSQIADRLKTSYKIIFSL